MKKKAFKCWKTVPDSFKYLYNIIAYLEHFAKKIWNLTIEQYNS